MAVPVAASAAAKRLWSVLRITFLMIRKGLIISNYSKSKRKLMMDLNFMTKRGRLLKRSFRKFIIAHQSSSSSKKLHYEYDGGFGIQEYEFSCSNSPNTVPVFFHTSSKAKQQQQQHSRHYSYVFPCINPPPRVQFDIDNDYDYEQGEEANVNDMHKAVVMMQQQLPKTPDGYFKRNSYSSSSSRNSPLLNISASSPFSVRVSNYSSTEVVDVDQNSGRQVDDEAEEFIKRFYEQLRAQSRIQTIASVSG